MHSPYDGSVIGEVPACTAADVDRAVASAKAALAGRAAAAVEAGRDPRRGGPAADRAAGGVRPDHRRRGGQADQDGPGRGRAGGRARSSSPPPRPASWPARWSRSTPPRRARASSGFTLRVPIGVVGAIAPFNFPLNLVAHKVAPAIAAGCPVVLKPASQTPFSAIALAELLIDECGLPADQLHVVTGGGGTVGNALVDHPDIALITFTGSPDGRLGHPGPGAAQAGRPRARQQRAGHHRARRRLAGRGRQDQGRRLQPRRPELHLDAADLRAPLDRRRLHRRAGRGRRSRSSSAIRWTRPPTCRR